MRIDAAIIGVHKCGTTALLQTLLQHPSIASHPTGQWPDFLSRDDYREAWPGIMKTYFEEQDASKTVIVRDTRLYLDMVALGRLEELSPGVKAIVIIKEPVERAYSAFCFARAKGYETGDDFGKLIAEQRDGRFVADKPLVCNYISMGMYHRNLTAIRNVLSGDRVCVLFASELKSNPVETCNRVFRFLDLPEMAVEPMILNQTRKTRSNEFETFIREDSILKSAVKALLPLRLRLRIRRKLAKLNTTSEKFPPMDPAHERALVEIFREDGARLKRDFGIDFAASAAPEAMRASAGS